MKIVEFFLIMWGKLFELEPEKNGPAPQHCGTGTLYCISGHMTFMAIVWIRIIL
jgi:hypothetical protein